MFCIDLLKGGGHSQPAQIHVIPISVVHQGGGNLSFLQSMKILTLIIILLFISSLLSGGGGYGGHSSGGAYGGHAGGYGGKLYHDT